MDPALTPRMPENQDEWTQLQVWSARLMGVLETARKHDVRRVLICAGIPASPATSDDPHWLLAPTPGWQSGPHRYQSPPTGRFQHQFTEHRVDLKVITEWTDKELDPSTAHEVLKHLEWRLRKAKALAPSTPLQWTPSRTGLKTWGMSLNAKTKAERVELDAPIADLIHQTSGQHRIECTGDPGDPELIVRHHPADATVGTLVAIDGRFMYAACLRELHFGAARMMDAAECQSMIDAAQSEVSGGASRKPALNAIRGLRMHVTAEVPADWHHLGLLPRQIPHATQKAWDMPNLPGCSFDTWASDAEIRLALDHGWHLTAHEGLHFGAKTRAADTWVDQLMRARESGRHHNSEVDQLSVRAIRKILIATIGGWNSRGQSTATVMTEQELERDGVGSDVINVQPMGGMFVVTRDQARQKTPDYAPQLSSQVWGRARAAVLSSRYGGGVAGALALPAEAIIGIQGDAIYVHSSTVPQWCLPTVQGGLDDGKPGRLRVKGIVRDCPRPESMAQARRWIDTTRQA